MFNSFLSSFSLLLGEDNKLIQISTAWIFIKVSIIKNKKLIY
jgi:hypothetical protein